MVSIFGTDLFIAGDIDAAGLRAVLAEIMPVAVADIFDFDDTTAYDAFGLRNIVRLQALPLPGTLTFKADLDFTAPIPIAAMQRLADARDLAVLLSRDTAFPNEAGTGAGEGYVVFSKGTAPRAGSLLAEERGDEMVYAWRLLSEPLPPL